MNNVELTKKIMELVDFAIEGDEITISLNLLNVYYKGNWLFDYDTTGLSDVLIYATNNKGTHKWLIDRNNPNKKDLEKVSQIVTDSINRVEALIECKD